MALLLHKSDPPVLQLQVQDREIHYTDQGPSSGPTVLAIHGYPGSPKDFRYMGPHLEPELRLIRLALAGQGHSPEDGGTSLPERVAFVRRFLDGMGLEKVMLLGHSMGGGISQAVAVADERVNALALLASVGLRKHKGLRWTSPKVLPALRSELGWRAMRPGIRQAFTGAGFPTSTGDGPMRNALISALELDFEVLNTLPEQISVPTLVAWTDDDALVEPEISQEIADRLPKGPRLHFEKGGHNLQKQHAAAISSEILAMLL
ncbi:MAG: pimeloyl-ACP methyl ester carboxylesterase [Cognaticolwellia sp.]|jgi:pimeloyl-ACP methyl ester carboxylesterase